MSSCSRGRVELGWVVHDAAVAERLEPTMHVLAPVAATVHMGRMHQAGRRLFCGATETLSLL